MNEHPPRKVPQDEIPTALRKIYGSEVPSDILEMYSKLGGRLKGNYLKKIRTDKEKQMESLRVVIDETISRLKDVDAKGASTKYSNTEALKGDAEFATDDAAEESSTSNVLTPSYVDAPSDFPLSEVGVAAPLDFGLSEPAPEAVPANDTPIEIPASVRNVFKSGRERKVVEAEAPLSDSDAIALNDAIEAARQFGSPEELREAPRPEEKVVPVAEVETILRELLEKGGVEVKQFTITETPSGPFVRSELYHKGAGKIDLVGIIENAGNTVRVQDLKVRADSWESLVKGKIEDGLSGLDAALKERFGKESGKPVSSMQIGESGLTVEFEPESEKMTANPEDAPIGMTDATAAENRGKFREVMARAAEAFGWYKSSGEHLIRRRVELDAQAEKIPGMERLFRKWGESYNKMPFKYKLLMGGALGLGSVLTAGTLAMVLPLLGIGAQRVFGLSTMYLKFEKKSHDEAWGRNKEWGKQKALLKAGIYTALLGLTMKEAIEQLGETEIAHAAQAKISGWLGDVFGHKVEDVAPFPNEGHSMSDTPENSHPIAPDKMVPTAAPDIQPAAPEPFVTKPVIGLQSDVAEVRRLDNLMMQPEAAPLARVEVPASAPSAVAGEAIETSSATSETMPEDFGTAETPAAPETASGETVEQLSGPAEAAPEAASSEEVPEQTSNLEEPPAEVQTNQSVTEGQNMDIDEETRRRALESVAPETNPLTGLVDEQPPAPVETIVPRPVYPMDIEISQPTEPPQIDVIQHPETPAVSIDTSVPQPEASPAFEIDPARGQVFQTIDNKIVAYGTDYGMRFNAAQEFAKAHPGTSVWVQAEKPVLDPTTNTLRPWIQELRWEKGFLGFGGSIKVLNPIGPTSPDQIGAIMSKSFIKQLVK